MDNITLYVLPIGDNENGYIIPENTANVLLRQLVPGQTIIQGGEAISISDQVNFRIETSAPNVEKTEPSASKKSKFALTCTMCQIEFSNAKQYKEHITKHFKKKFKCEKCGMGFNKEVNFTIHALTEHSDNLTCPFCNVSFQRKAAFQSHVKLHKSEETHCCEFCKAEFSHEDELVRHIKNHNFPVEISDLICNYCKLLLPDVESYKKHLDSHKKLTKTITRKKIIRRKVPISPNKNYSHRCYACDKSFPKFSLLERHNRIHSGEKPFSCGFCNKRFNQKGTLKIHMTCHTGYKPFVCTLCPAKFNQKCNLKSHVRKTHSAPKDGETTFKCSECDCLFKKIGSLNTHVNKAHSASVMDQLKQLENDLNPIDSGLISFNKNTNKNNQEEISNITYEDVISNENTEKSKELYIKLTETIGRPSGRLRTYLIKLVMIDNVKNYECMYCKNLFKKPSDLLRHLRIHTNERPFKCKVCSSNFRVKSTLTKHMNTHDTRNNSSCQKYGCSSCDSTFTSIFAYNKHFRTKHNTKKAQDKTLSVDEKMENNSQNITTDLVLREPLLETNQGLLPLTKNESPYRPHICQKCNASFSKKTHLKRHMYSHEEKKFKCTKCSKSYSFQNALKDHMKFHNPVKKFECSECTKKFVTKSLLLRHLISHSESTPFICPYCNKKFKSINFCRRHIKIHKRHLLEMLQDGQTNENNIHEEILKNPPLNKATKNQQATKNFISKNNEYLLTTNITPNNETPESNSTISDVDNTSKVYNINFVDLDMNEMIYSQTKLQNSDSIILNSIQDFQENNLLFNVQDTQANSGNNLELYTPIFASNSTENDTEIPVKEKETNSVTLQNYNLLENVTFLPNVTFTSNGENEYNINILEGSTEPQVQNDQLTIISGENFDQNYVINFCNACKKIFNSSEHICEPESENATEVSEITVPEENIDTINNVNEQQQSTEQIYVNDDPINAENDQQELTKSVSVNDKIKKKNVKDESKKKTVDRICSFCEKEFKKPSDLIRHVRIHTGEKPFQCDICQKRFALKCTLDSHVKTHSSLAEKFTCTICNKNFSSKTSRKLHMSIHTGQKPYSCKFCDLNFRTIANKNSHEKSIHLNPKKVHKPKATDILEKAAMESLDTLFTGNNHENIVNNEIQLSATEAIEILNPSNNLPFDSNLIQPIQNGSLILTDDNVANMDLLQNTVIHFIDSDSILNFTKQTDLTTEKDALNNGEIYINWLQTQPSDDLSIQNNIAPNSIQQNMVQNNITESLECEICKKECSSKEMLRKHLNLHKKKKFMCGVCLKLFENADDLEVHSDTHNGVRTFCNYCDNAFFDEQHLKTHMKRIHQV